MGDGATPTPNPGDGGTPDPKTPVDDGGKPDIDYKAEAERLKAENARLLEKKSALEGDLHKVREKRQQELAELEEQGKYKVLSEEQKARIAELEALEDDAKLGRSYREREEQRIATVRDKMDDGWKKALDDAPGFLAKANLVDLFQRQQDQPAGSDDKKPPEPKPDPPPDGGGPPAGGPSDKVDIPSLIAEHGADAVRAKYPKEFEAWRAGSSSSTPKRGTGFGPFRFGLRK